MNPTRVLLAFFAAAQLALVLFPAFAQEPAEAITRYGEVMRRLDGDQEVSRHFASCPGDIFLTRKAFWHGLVDPDVSADQCRDDPAQCLTACLDGRNERSCFALARVLQDDLPRDRGDYASMLFAESCAAGGAGGCTNRAAATRNGGYPRDPFHERDVGEIEMCLLHSFHVACAEDDAWGCTMLGQALELGEGTEPNADFARQFYLKACMLAPDFAACAMAKENLEGLE